MQTMRGHDLTISFTTSKEWLVANGADSCQATVQVKNSTVGVPGLKIEFSVLDTDYGSFDQPIVYTDTEGKAVSTFKVNHKSGTATLKATITDPSGTIPVIAPKEMHPEDRPRYPLDALFIRCNIGNDRRDNRTDHHGIPGPVGQSHR